MISGMTCTVYTVCAAIAGQGLPYSLSNFDQTGLAAAAKGLTDFACTEDFIGGFQLLDLIITELKSHMTC
jgi:hypothetical protein